MPAVPLMGSNEPPERSWSIQQDHPEIVLFIRLLAHDFDRKSVGPGRVGESKGRSRGHSGGRGRSEAWQEDEEGLAR
jgi:hypothetical protein